MKLNFSFLKQKKSRSLEEWKRINQGMNPIRDWMIGITVAAVVFICGVSYVAYDFLTLLESTATEIETEDRPVTYHEKEVIEYAEKYTKNEQTFKELRAEKVFISEDKGVHEATSSVPTTPVSSGNPVAN